MADKIEKYVDSLSLNNKLARLVWLIFATVFFVPFAGPLFRGWRTLMLRLWGAKVGMHCSVASGAKLWAPWKLELADYVSIASSAQIYNVDRVSIGSKVTVSQEAFICTASHDVACKNKPLIHSPIRLGDFSWVCARAIVLPGVTIGEGSVVGAGSVVTKDVEPWTVVGGNPAKFIKKRELKND